MKMKITHGRLCTLFIIISLVACWQVDAHFFWRVQRTYGVEHIRSLPLGVTCMDVIGAIKEKGSCLCAGDSIFHVVEEGFHGVCMVKDELCSTGPDFFGPCYLGYGILGYRNFSDNVPRKVLRFVVEGSLLDCKDQGKVNGSTEEWDVNEHHWKIVDRDDSYVVREFADHREIQIAEEEIESALLRLRFGCTWTNAAVTLYVKLLQNATYPYPPLLPDTTTSTTGLTTPTVRTQSPTLNVTTQSSNFTTVTTNFTAATSNFTTPTENLTTSRTYFTNPPENFTTTSINSTTPAINTTIFVSTFPTNTTVVTIEETTPTNRTTVNTTNEPTTQTTTQETTVVSSESTSTIAVIIGDTFSDRKTMSNRFMIILAVVVGCLILLILFVLVLLKRRRRGGNGITTSPSRRVCVRHEEHQQHDDSREQPVSREKFSEINPDNYATLTGNYKYEENYQTLQRDQNEVDYFETEAEYHDPDMIADFSKRMPPNWYAYQDMSSQTSEPFYIQAGLYSSINSIDKASDAPKYENNDRALNYSKGSAISYEDAEEIARNRKGMPDDNASTNLDNDFNDFEIV